MRVRGVGPAPCDILICGEGPGYAEDRTGIPFCGKTGEELNRHLDVLGLSRSGVFLTNIYRQYMGKDYVWAAEDLARDEPELLKELRRVSPSTIVTLGRHATRYFLGDVDMDGVWGIPWVAPRDAVRLDNPRVVIFPIHHPAAGMHNPELSPYVVAGFQRLGEYLKGQVEPRILFNDEYPEPYYHEITTEADLLHVTSHWTKDTIVAIDTEGWAGKPWSLQFSSEPGSGFLIRATATELVRAFFRILHQRVPRVCFHSALHDLAVGRSIDPEGRGFNGLPFEDTMVAAYLLQIEPQGLKPSLLRHCNMKQDEYKDIVGDKANELAREYLTWLYDSEQTAYEAKCEAEFYRRKNEVWADKKGRSHIGRRITKIPQLPKSKFHQAITRVLGSKRPHDLWKDQVEDIQVAGYDRLGPLPEATLDYVPSAVAVRYGCRDADGTTRLYPRYRDRVDAMGLGPTYALELGTYPLLDRMQQVGIKPDLEQFRQLGEVLDWEVGRLRSELCAVTGNDTFNANSGDQVADYLFGDLNLEEMKFTSSGRGSTNDKILEALEREHPEFPQITTIRQYREFYKLKHTFVDRIPDYVNRWPYDGRVHATLRTTRVVTGRLAAADPNLLAQPEHGKWAKDFQRGWVAEDGHYLYAADQSQVELRGLAHLSEDPILLAVYRGELRNPDGSLIDLHAKLAQRIFGGRVEDYMYKCPQRLAAKAINFGIPMGMTCRGLSVELRKNGVEADEDTAQRWIDETLRLYTGVSAYMSQRIAEAQRHGYIRCLSGRIRYIGGIRSHDERVREEAERFAFSTPIQESAQFIMKQAEIRVWNEVLPYFWDKGVYCEPLLQAHDCLKLEVQRGYERELHGMMVEAMTHVPVGFKVPLVIEDEYGLTFADTRGF